MTKGSSQACSPNDGNLIFFVGNYFTSAELYIGTANEGNFGSGLQYGRNSPVVIGC